MRTNEEKQLVTQALDALASAIERGESEQLKLVALASCQWGGATGWKPVPPVLASRASVPGTSSGGT